MPRTVYQLWRNLGPYHLVRAEAAAKRLAEHDIDLVAVQIAAGEATRDWRMEESKERGFQIATLAADRNLTLDRSTPSQWSRLRFLFEKNPPAGVCIAGYDRAEMRAALSWCRRSGTPSVLMSETKWNDSPRPWWKQMVLRHFIGKAGAGLVTGSLSADFFRQLGVPTERIFQPYGVIDNGLFSAAAKTYSRDSENPYFLVCCRLIESRKNLSALFDAYAAYRKKCESPLSLVICGDGEDRDLYHARTQGLGVSDHVSFVGFQQAEQVAEYYARATAFVHTAKEEAWGLVMNEAMAAGLPVLVSKACGSAPDLVQEGENGFTFAPGDTDLLTDLLVRVTNMSTAEREAMGRKSQDIITAWSPEAFGQAQLAALAAAGMSLSTVTPAVPEPAKSFPEVMPPTTI